MATSKKTLDWLDELDECDSPMAVLQLICEDEEQRIAREKRLAWLGIAGLVLVIFIVGFCFGFLF